MRGTNAEPRSAAPWVVAVLLAGCSADVRGGAEEGEGGGGGAATTAAATASGPGPGTTTSTTTGGEPDHPLCIERDPDVEVDVTVTLSHWGAGQPGHAPNIELRARCEVRSAAPGGGAVDASLGCVDDAGGDFDAELSFVIPPDVAIDLASGETVHLDLAAHGTQGEIGPGSRLAIEDESGDLIVAAYDDETDGYVADSWSGMLAPLEVSMDHTICADRSCPTEASPECPEGGTFQRHGLIVTAGEHGVHLVDGRRDVLTTENGSYDVLVGSAAGYFKISSRFSYRFLIARQR